MKKIIFFDGDGTLWGPKHKKYHEPWHIYIDEKADPLSECEPTNKAIEVLAKVGEMGIKRVLLSTSPFEYKKAMQDRTNMVRSMGMFDLLDDIQMSPDYPAGKSEKILELLESYGFSANDALMVGDMYKWDYKPAKDVGVDALLIERKYSYKDYVKDSSIITIHKIEEVLDHLK